MNQGNKLFWILVCIVSISGFSQGMLLPLIAVIFEKDGLSSSLNGINATALYIGILLASPFMEYPLRKFGYRPLIMVGGLIVIISLAMFPLWKSFWFWFFLRFLIGVGDHALHFGTQTWITSFSPENRRGRNISLYGFAFGLGFAVGPLMTPLVKIHEALPFLLSSAMCLIGWVLLFWIKNEYPEEEGGVGINTLSDTIGRFSKVWKYAWVAFLPPLGYGFLESSLSGSFPVYGLRTGLNVTQVSILLTSLAIGGLVTQLPLGVLSDRFGRRKVLTIVLFLGFVCFTAASFLEAYFIPLTISIFVAGMCIGSLFSLGISLMADLLPKNLLPTGNIFCGIFFSFGSLIGPFLGGTFIQFFEGLSFFLIVSGVLLIISLAMISFKENRQGSFEQQNVVK